MLAADKCLWYDETMYFVAQLLFFEWEIFLLAKLLYNSLSLSVRNATVKMWYSQLQFKIESWILQMRKSNTYRILFFTQSIGHALQYIMFFFSYKGFGF